jgi:hypothetical protein
MVIACGLLSKLIIQTTTTIDLYDFTTGIVGVAYQE